MGRQCQRRPARGPIRGNGRAAILYESTGTDITSTVVVCQCALLRITEGRLTMPQKGNYYEPDAIDCNTMATAIGQDFSHLCKTEVEFARDSVVVTCRCYGSAAAPDDAPSVQSRATKPLKSRPDISVMLFSAMLDCWHQLDRGVLGAKPPAISHGWNGRPTVPRRRDS